MSSPARTIQIVTYGPERAVLPDRRDAELGRVADPLEFVGCPGGHDWNTSRAMVIADMAFGQPA